MNRRTFFKLPIALAVSSLAARVAPLLYRAGLAKMGNPSIWRLDNFGIKSGRVWDVGENVWEDYVSEIEVTGGSCGRWGFYCGSYNPDTPITRIYGVHSYDE